MDIEHRSKALIHRLERKLAMKEALRETPHDQRHAANTLIHDNGFNFPRVSHHIPIEGA